MALRVEKQQKDILKRMEAAITSFTSKPYSDIIATKGIGAQKAAHGIIHRLLVTWRDDIFNSTTKKITNGLESFLNDTLQNLQYAARAAL